VAFPAAETSARPATSSARLAERWRSLVAHVESYPLERVGLAAIAAGVVLRLLAPFFMDLRSDGDTYTAMGQAWAMHREFIMPYGDVTTWAATPPGYSNHYPPAYPFFLGIVFSLFGFGLWQAKWAAVFISILALVAVYATTRDLYGRTAAALAAGIMALEPHLLWVTGAGFSENMVLLFFALTMWAIVRSLEDDRYIVLAGLFAGLTYLSRASVGYFFVIAGTGGFFWRLAYRGWGVLANKWYLSAIVLFLGIMGAWAYRNVSLFGYAPEVIVLGPSLLLAAGALGAFALTLLLPFAINSRLRRWPNFVPGIVLLAVAGALAAWAGILALGDGFARSLTLMVPLWETSSYTRYVQDLAIQKSDMWRHALLAKIPFFLAFFGWYALPMLPESWKAAARFREERTSALWLSVALVWVIAWAITAMFWVFEQSSLYWLDNRRYVLIGCLPLLWLILREARPERASFRLRYVLFALSLFAACGATLMSPVKFSDLRAAEHMDPYLRPGDEIAVDGNTIKYAFYAYLTHPEQVRIYGWGSDGYSPDFIVTLKPEVYYGDEYERVGEFRQTYWNGGVMTAYLLARDDIIAERGIRTGIVVAN